jgi:lipopolysaccharide export system permease protein
MGVIDRLLVREILKTLLVIVLVLALVLLANTLVRYLGKAAVGVLGTDVLLLVVGLELLRAIGLILPPAFFFAVLWVLGNMHRDSEMTALAASGFGHARLFRSVLLLAVPLALVVTVLVMELLPWARGQVDRIKLEEAQSMDISGVRPGRFNEFSRGGLVVYAEQAAADGRGLQGLLVQDRQHGQIGLVTAERAYQLVDPDTGERHVVLTDGRRYEGVPGQRDYAIGRFETYTLRIPEIEPLPQRLRRSAKPWRMLLASDTPADRAELHARIAIPLVLIAFGVLAVPLARVPPRSGVYGRLLLAVFLYFLVINLQRVAESWLEEGSLPGWLGLWWLPLAMLGFTWLLLVIDSNRFRHWRRRWRTGSA